MWTGSQRDLSIPNAQTTRLRCAARQVQHTSGSPQCSQGAIVGTSTDGIDRSLLRSIRSSDQYGLSRSCLARVRFQGRMIRTMNNTIPRTSPGRCHLSRKDFGRSAQQLARDVAPWYHPRSRERRASFRIQATPGLLSLPGLPSLPSLKEPGILDCEDWVDCVDSEDSALADTLALSRGPAGKPYRVIGDS